MYEKDTNGPMDTGVPDSNPTVRPTLTLQEGLDRRASSMRVYGENIGQELAWLCGVITSLVDRVEVLEHKLDSYIAMDTFNPDDYVHKDDFDPDDFINRNDFDPDNYDFDSMVTEHDLERVVAQTLNNASISLDVSI